MRVKDDGLEGLEQTVVVCAPETTTSRSTGEDEEVLFVVEGRGELRLSDGTRHSLEPETGVNLGPGEKYELSSEASGPMRMVCVRVRGRAVPGGSGGAAGPADSAGPAGPLGAAASAGDGGAEDGRARTVVRRLADVVAQDATTERMFRIVADPATGLRGATHFVGYVPPTRAPDHFHTYDEVIYVLEGEGAFHAGGTSRPLSAGSCIELPARTVHCLENTGQGVMRLVAVFTPPGSPAAAYYPDGTPAYPGAPLLT
ncbi:MAG: cupin domain-containing protein [Solirubrobacterales bacterium]|nr:cupin domain-containing protein [Solirubrobacterales bacterium]